MKERTVWTFTTINLLVLCTFFCGHTYQTHQEGVERLGFLIKTYDAETDILEAQLADTLSEINKRESSGYQEGFEAGRTQAGIAFLHDGALQSYGDGYHAAPSQWGGGQSMIETMTEDQALNVLMNIMTKNVEKEIEDANLEAKQ